MKKATKKLALHRETLLRLEVGTLDKVQGGVPTYGGVCCSESPSSELIPCPQV